jgi:ribosomal protein S18
MPSKARTKRRDEKPGRRRDEKPGRRIRKRVCYFCAEGIEHIDYKDVALLRKFMSDRAKIRSSRVTGNCVQHQRRVARAIRNARELALLPYTNR